MMPEQRITCGVVSCVIGMCVYWSGWLLSGGGRDGRRRILCILVCFGRIDVYVSYISSMHTTYHAPERHQVVDVLRVQVPHLGHAPEVEEADLFCVVVYGGEGIYMS